jgi:hypothetical protein
MPIKDEARQQVRIACRAGGLLVLLGALKSKKPAQT